MKPGGGAAPNPPIGGGIPGTGGNGPGPGPGGPWPTFPGGGTERSSGGIYTLVQNKQLLEMCIRDSSSTPLNSTWTDLNVLTK